MTTDYIGKMYSQVHLTVYLGSRPVGSRLGKGEMSRGMVPTEEEKEDLGTRFYI